MGNHPRPLLLGYIRADVLATRAEVARAESDLQAFADCEEFTLARVYVENGSATGAFDALVDELARTEEAWGVVVPDQRHLAAAEQRVLGSEAEDSVGMPVFVARWARHPLGAGDITSPATRSTC
jgi:hypothetical protein